MSQPRSEVLRALEREMLFELGAPEQPDGWVVTIRTGPNCQQVVPWTFGDSRRGVYNALLDLLDDACRANLPFARGFPIHGERSVQLRWARRHGHCVKKAAVRVME